MRTATVLAVLLASAPAAWAQGFTVDRDKKEIHIPCKIAPRKLPNLPEIYPIEVVATFPAPHGQKAHETVITMGAKPQELHKALEGLGLQAGKPARGDDAVATGAALDVLLEIPEKGKATKKRIPIETALMDRKTGKPLPALTWHFTGSIVRQVDPAKPDKVYAADTTGTLVGIYPVTDELVIQSSLTMKEEGLIKLETNKEVLPAEGTDALLIIRPAGPKPAAAAAAPARASAEMAPLNATHQAALKPVKAPAAAGTPVTAPPAADASNPKKDLRAAGSVADEAKPLPLPIPAPPGK